MGKKKKSSRIVWDVFLVIGLVLLGYSIMLPSMVLAVTLGNRSEHVITVTVWLDGDKPHETVKLDPGASKRVKLWGYDDEEELFPEFARFVAIAEDEVFVSEASFSGEQLIEAMPAKIIVTEKGLELLRPETQPADSNRRMN